MRASRLQQLQGRNKFMNMTQLLMQLVHLLNRSRLQRSVPYCLTCSLLFIRNDEFLTTRLRFLQRRACLYYHRGILAWPPGKIRPF